MGLGISNFSGITREEKRVIGLLLSQSVLLGIFYGILNIAAYSVFLSGFDEGHMARAFIISGLAALVLIYLYSLLRRKISFRSLSLINLALIFLLTVYLWILFRSSPGSLAQYSLFILPLPLFLLSLTGHMSTAERLFRGPAYYRLSGLLDSGLILGILTGSLSIPLILSYGYGMGDTIIISLISILLVLFIQILIARDHKLNTVEEISAEYRRGRPGLKGYGGYLKTLFIFIVLSALVFFFIQYPFMAVTRSMYPAEAAMAGFLGYFEGGLMALALLTRILVFPYFIKKQGLKVSLAFPVLLIGFSAAAALITGVSTGIIPGTTGFIIFFTMLALSRVLSKAFQYSFEWPAMRIIVPAGSEKTGPAGRTVSLAVMAGAGLLISGLLLSALDALDTVRLIHFSWALLIIIIPWLVYALRLYNKYRVSIRRSLEAPAPKPSYKGEDSISGKFNSVSSSGLFIENNYYELITGSGLYGDISENRLLMQQIVNKAEKEYNPDIIPLLEKILSGNTQINGLAARINSLIINIKARLEQQDMGEKKDLLSTIEESSNRRLHLQALMMRQDTPVITDLMRLIRDQDNEVRKETLYIAGKFRIRELLPEICECLDNKIIAADAYSVLAGFGQEAYPALTGHFFRSPGNIKVRRLLLRLIALGGDKRATDFLVPRIWSGNRLLRKEAVSALISCDYEAGEEARDKIHQEIKGITGLLSWNLSAQLTVRNSGNDLLADTLEEESRWWKDFLFDILSLVYERRTLDTVVEKIRTGSAENINQAFETLGILVDREVFPQLRILLDNTTLREKVKNLDHFCPVIIPEYKLLVQDLVNKDYNHIGVWTKVCALRSLYKLPSATEPDFLIALLFSVNRILREEAFMYLQEYYEGRYAQCSYRLPKVYGEQLDRLLHGDNNGNDLICNKLMSLSLVFPSLQGNSLISLAEDVRRVDSPVSGNTDPESDFIIWPVDYSPGDGNSRLYFNWHTGGLRLNIKNVTERTGPCYLLPVKSVEQFVFYEPGESRALMKCLDEHLLKSGQMDDLPLAVSKI